jgi:hypothetical protein
VGDAVEWKQSIACQNKLRYVPALPQHAAAVRSLQVSTHQHMPTCTCAAVAVNAHLRSTYVSALNLLAASTSAKLDFGVIELMAAHATSAHRLQTSRAFAASLLLLLGPEQRYPRITCTAAAGSTEMLDIKNTQLEPMKTVIAQQSCSKELHKSQHIVRCAGSCCHGTRSKPCNLHQTRNNLAWIDGLKPLWLSQAWSDINVAKPFVMISERSCALWF